ncbi:MAG: hypothetical protein ABEI52_12585, partial [Halobacteriaceae archaeon]
MTRLIDLEEPLAPDRAHFTIAALLSVALLLAASLATLIHVVVVLGGWTIFILLVTGAIALGYVLAKTLEPRFAFAFSVVLLALGLSGYLLSVPPSYWALFSIDRIVSDMI